MSIIDINLMSTDEKELVTRAVQGDGEAFARLYEGNLNKVYRYIYLKIGNHAECEDFTQEVFLKALEAIGSYRWRNLSFAAWLLRIAHNHLIDHFRRESKVEKVPWDDNVGHVESANPAAVAEQRIQAKELAEKVNRLAPAQREVILLRFGGELSVAEVASVLGKTTGTVKALQHSGILALRKTMLASG